jgi:hypothetical protein
MSDRFLFTEKIHKEKVSLNNLINALLPSKDLSLGRYIITHELISDSIINRWYTIKSSSYENSIKKEK